MKRNGGACNSPYPHASRSADSLVRANHFEGSCGQGCPRSVPSPSAIVKFWKLSMNRVVAQAARPCEPKLTGGTPVPLRQRPGSWPPCAILGSSKLSMNRFAERGQPCPREPLRRNLRTRLSALRSLTGGSPVRTETHGRDARATTATPRFMAAMRDSGIVEAFHEPLRGARTALSARTTSKELADKAVRAPFLHGRLARANRNSRAGRPCHY